MEITKQTLEFLCGGVDNITLYELITEEERGHNRPFSEEEVLNYIGKIQYYIDIEQNEDNIGLLEVLKKIDLNSKDVEQEDKDYGLFYNGEQNIHYIEETNIEKESEYLCNGSIVDCRNHFFQKFGSGILMGATPEIEELIREN